MIAKRVGVFDLTGQNVGDGFYAAVRVPRKATLIGFRLVVAEIVEQ